MAGLSFGGAMDERIRGSRVRQDQEWADVETRRIAAMRSGQGGGGQAPAKPMGLAQAKTPTWSTMIAPTPGSVPGRQPTMPSSSPQSNAVGQSPAIDTGSLTGTQLGGMQPLTTSIFDELTIHQGLRRGTSYVKDKKGTGDPQKDTVPAKLAEGEAVLNAAAAETLGRDEIERLNEEGAAKMGLRGGAKMVDGVMHAKNGITDTPGYEGTAVKGAAADKLMNKYFGNAANVISPQEIRAGLGNRKTQQHLLDAADDTMRRSDAIYKAGQVAPSSSTPAAPILPREVPSSRGFAGDAGAMVGRAMRDPWATAKGVAKKAIVPAVAAYGAATDGFTYAPDKGENPVSSTAKNLGLQAGNVGTRALDLMSTDLINLPSNIIGKPDVIEPFNSIYRKNMVGAGVATQRPEPSAQARATQAIQPQVIELSGPPSEYERGMRAQVEARKADNAEFSKFFNANGITDEMRANPAQAGLRRVNVPGSTDRIYQRGKNEFVGMGAPSRIAAEEARANDPAVQKAEQMKYLQGLAMQGNEQAGETLRQIIQADSAREVEGLRGQALIRAAGTKGAGKKGSGDDWSLTEKEKLGKMQINDEKGNPLPIVQGMHDRVNNQFAEFQKKFRAAEGNPEKQAAIDAEWSAVKDSIMSEGGQLQTGNMLQTQQSLDENSQGNRALKGGLAGGLIGGVGTTAAGLLLKKPNLIRKGLYGLAAGGSAGAAYGWGTGAAGVPIPANIDQLAPDAVHYDEKNGELVSNTGRGTVRVPIGLLSEAERARYGLRQ